VPGSIIFAAWTLLNEEGHEHHDVSFFQNLAEAWEEGA